MNRFLARWASFQPSYMRQLFGLEVSSHETIDMGGGELTPTVIMKMIAKLETRFAPEVKIHGACGLGQAASWHLQGKPLSSIDDAQLKGKNLSFGVADAVSMGGKLVKVTGNIPPDTLIFMAGDRLEIVLTNLYDPTTIPAETSGEEVTA